MDRRVYDNYVLQIVEHGTLSKAAAFLGISQPALSSGLTALENELANLKGLFSGKRRKEIESRLAQIAEEISKLS